MAVLAHPDDESLGVGGTLAKYAAEGVEVSVLTATRGDAGRYRGHPPGTLRASWCRWRSAGIREAELRAAAAVLGVARARAARLSRPAARSRRRRRRRRRHRAAPAAHRVRTSSSRSGRTAPTGIPITSPSRSSPPRRSSPRPIRRTSAGPPAGGDEPHAVSKLYYLAWSAPAWAAFEAAFQTVDVRRSTVANGRRRPGRNGRSRR